jgi:hypothetical protein
MTSIKQQIVSHIQTLESDQVKSLVLNWLAQSEEGNLADFERLLETEYGMTHENAIVYGEIDEDLTFQLMTEGEMVKKSLEVLEEYQRTVKSISHHQVRDWLDSLGTDQPLSCPK